MNDAAQFVARFADFWSDPSPDRLGELLSPDVVLIQPLARTMRGLVNAKLEFRKIFALMPDLRGEVDRWSATDDVIFIEFRLSGTLGSGRVEWPLVDRFLVSDGMATERMTYFDPTPLVRALASRPGSWLGFARSGIWRGLL